MLRSRPIVRAAALLALALVGACGDGASSTDAKARPGPGEESEEVKKLRKSAEALRAEIERKWDEDSRALLASFASRAYDPRRDAGLEHAEGTMRVRAEGVEASYRYVFDVANPADRPVLFETISEPQGWDAARTTLARRIATMGFVGAYRIVVFHNPPTPLVLHPGKEKDAFVVHAPPFRSPLNVSYSIDPRQVVTARGEWTDETHKAVTKFEWEVYHNRYLVRRESIHEGAEIDYEYDHEERLVLLKRALVRVGESTSAEVLLETGAIRRR
jgi:hypothetical protein